MATLCTVRGPEGPAILYHNLSKLNFATCFFSIFTFVNLYFFNLVFANIISLYTAYSGTAEVCMIDRYSGI